MMIMLYVFLCTWPTSTVTVCSLKNWTGWQTCRFILFFKVHFLICARPHTLQIYISHTFHHPPALSQLQKMPRLSLTAPLRASQTFILFGTSFWKREVSVPYCVLNLLSQMLVSWRWKLLLKGSRHSRRRNVLARENVIQPFLCCQIHTSDMQMGLARTTSRSTEAFHLHPAIYFIITNLNI